MEKNTNLIEKFLFDKKLAAIADMDIADSERALAEMCAADPDKAQAITDAWLLLRGIDVSEDAVSATDVEASLRRLRARLRRRTLGRRAVAAVAASAAVLVVCFSLLYKPAADSADTSQMVTMLSRPVELGDSVEMQVGEQDAIRFGDNISVVQTEEGVISVNSREVTAVDKAKKEFVRLNVPYGKRSYAELPDGTRVWLNSGSSIVYPSMFESDRREVAVTGEVYMDVAKDPARPFFVAANDLRIKVLGTAFNISAYGDDPFTSIVLVEGSLEVKAGGGAKKVLAPGHILTERNGALDVEPADVHYHTAWKNGYIELREVALEDMFKRLSRYYNVNFCYNPIGSQVYLYGKFDLSDTLEQALDNISFSKPMTFTVNGNEIFVEFK